MQYARDLGIDLAFLSGNRVYRQVRLEADGQGNPNRIMCHYGDVEQDDPLWDKINQGQAAQGDVDPYPNLTSACSGQANPGLGALCGNIDGVPRPVAGPWNAVAF